LFRPHNPTPAPDRSKIAGSRRSASDRFFALPLLLAVTALAPPEARAACAPDLLSYYPGSQIAQWQPPPHPGGYVLDVRYDYLGAAGPRAFETLAVCLGTDVAPQSDLNLAADGTAPATPGHAYYYLVRAQNRCDDSPAGRGSDGAVIAARACP